MRCFRWLCVLLLVSGFVFWSNFVIQTEEVTVQVANLPSAFHGLRIVQLSDLHGREFERNSSYLLQSVRQSKPDIICITGDLFDEDTELSMLPPLLRGLCAIAPTYYVTGNHEWQFANLRSILEQMRSYGVCVLENDYAVLQRDSQKLIIAGVHDPCGPKDQTTPAQLVETIEKKEGQDACIVMLAHRNDTIQLWSSLGVELVLTGHCHGGVIRLPFVGAVFGPRRELFPKYDAGLYEKDGTKLFVNRGLGYTNVRLRLCNRPHLAVLVVVNNS